MCTATGALIGMSVVVVWHCVGVVGQKCVTPSRLIY
jgi:hypothetical protein